MLANELALMRAGRPVAVLCGGPSLLSSLERMPECAAYVSANEHGCRARPCDYIACVDNTHTVTKESMEDRLRAFNTPIVSPLLWADFRIADWTVDGNSGFHAVYVAWLLGGNPIIVAGMDCYTDPNATYFYTQREESSGHDKPLSYFTDLAAAFSAVMPGANIRVMGGPLAEVFPLYDPAETFAKFEPSKELLAKLQPSKLRHIVARESFCFWKNKVRFHQHLLVTEAEAARFAEAGWAQIVHEGAGAHRNRPGAPVRLPGQASGAAKGQNGA